MLSSTLRTRCTRSNRLALFAWFVVIGGLLLSGGSLAQAADVVLGKAAPKSQRVSFDEIDHSSWDSLLRQYVNDAGQVAYRRWSQSSADQAKLDQYLQTLTTADPNKPASKNAKLAFWINAYNAVTVKGILREYPTTSIRNHTAKLWGYNIWKNLRLPVGDTPINLDSIEHEVLRKMGEPRIHFAIVCASIGCPRLLNEAYLPEQLDEQLTRNAQHFFAQQQNFRVDYDSNRVYLSAILDWFGEDFGSGQQALLKAVAPYVTDNRASAFMLQKGVRVSYLDYDWGLNSQEKVAE